VIASIGDINFLDAPPLFGFSKQSVAGFLVFLPRSIA
jgi:hypothetical protein